MGQAGCSGCFAGLAGPQAKEAINSHAECQAAEKCQVSQAEDLPCTHIAAASDSSPAHGSCCAPLGETLEEPKKVTLWVDISFDQDGSILFRESSGAPEKAATPSDGAHVTVDLEIFLAVKEDGYVYVQGGWLLSIKDLQLQVGTGLPCMPEELELAIPKLKLGVASQVLCTSFGTGSGTFPEDADWQEFVKHRGKELLMKLTLKEAEDLHVATLPSIDRLKYASGRKDAGSNYYKRDRFLAALERYSLAAEMLNYIDDIKESTLNIEATQVRITCELNAAMCLLKLGKWREAEGVCSVILRARPDNEKALFRRARALLEIGEGARAEMDLKKVLEVNPENTEAKALLARAKREAKGSTREKKVYAKMLS